jgi:hypothetical protein
LEYSSQEVCAKSRNRKTSIKIQLLNNNNNVVDELQGDVISGNITLKNSVDSNFSRRSGSLQLLLKKEYSDQYYKIDLLHRVRIIIIIRDNVTGIDGLYDLGIFLLSNPQISQSIDSENITINLLDLMAGFDGTFGKSIDDLQKANITSGTNITTSIQATATDSSLMNLPSNQVMCESTTSVTIENISIEPSSNITDLLKAIMDDALNYDLYFNNDGVLIFEYIKNRDNDIIF